jgi:hypothetical protein
MKYTIYLKDITPSKHEISNVGCGCSRYRLAHETEASTQTDSSFNTSMISHFVNDLLGIRWNNYEIECNERHLRQLLFIAELHDVKIEFVK